MCLVVARPWPTPCDPRAAARLALLPVGFSRQEQQSGWPLPSPGVANIKKKNKGQFISSGKALSPMDEVSAKCLSPAQDSADRGRALLTAGSRLADEPRVSGLTHPEQERGTRSHAALLLPPCPAEPSPGTFTLAP